MEEFFGFDDSVDDYGINNLNVLSNNNMNVNMNFLPIIIENNNFNF